MSFTKNRDHRTSSPHDAQSTNVLETRSSGRQCFPKQMRNPAVICKPLICKPLICKPPQNLWWHTTQRDSYSCSACKHDKTAASGQRANHWPSRIGPPDSDDQLSHHQFSPVAASAVLQTFDRLASVRCFSTTSKPLISTPPEAVTTHLPPRPRMKLHCGSTALGVL